MRLHKLTALVLAVGVSAATRTMVAVTVPSTWDRQRVQAHMPGEALPSDRTSEQGLENGDPPAEPVILKPRPVPKVPAAYRPQPKPQPPARPTPVIPGASGTPSPSNPAPTPPITRPT